MWDFRSLSNSLPRPTNREQFEIAIICALPREADAVALLFDSDWDGHNDEGRPYSKARRDTNYYTYGRIGQHDVVLTTLPEMGTTSAAMTSANLRLSRLRLVLLVGICGGAPFIGNTNAFLGDIVISRSIIQYDYGRQYPGQFIAKQDIEDSLGRASRDIRSLISHLQGDHSKQQLQSRAAVYLKQLQEAAVSRRWQADYTRPDQTQDVLFQPGYIHKHHSSCEHCGQEDLPACKRATSTSCSELSCAQDKLVKRERRMYDGEYTQKVFIRRIGSGNTVMKSGLDRDRIAQVHELIAFEMEASGAWEDLPCIVVKGICDYADSHKNKLWQDFSAATAASVGKAILDYCTVSDPETYDGTGVSALQPAVSKPVEPEDTHSILGTDIVDSQSIPTGQTTNESTLKTKLDSMDAASYGALHVIALFDDHDIPFEFAHAACRTFCDVKDPEESLANLMKASFLKNGNDRSTVYYTYSIDKAAQDECRSNLSKDPRGSFTGSGKSLLASGPDFVSAALSILWKAFPEPSVRNWEKCERALHHALQACEWTHTCSYLTQLAKTPLIDRVPTYLLQIGSYSELTQFTTKISEARQQALGKEHRSTLKTMTELAMAYNEQRQYKDAEKLAKKVLTIQLQIWGARDLDTVKSMVALSISYNGQSRQKKAKDLILKALEVQRKVYGDKDHVTLRYERYSAFILFSEGHHETAEKEMRNTLEKQERYLGKNHPDTMRTIQTLGYILLEQDRDEDALKFFERSFRLQSNILGEKHPDTLYSMEHVIYLCERQDCYEKAIRLGTRLLSLRRGIDGDQHPSTISAMHSLSSSQCILDYRNNAMFIKNQLLQRN